MAKHKARTIKMINKYIGTHGMNRPKKKYRDPEKPGHKRYLKENPLISITKKKKIQKEFLTPDQRRELAKIKKNYENLTNDQLKELLSINRQAKTGKRKELLTRCAEGKLLGGLTNCPKCKEGRLNFDIKIGEYFCKGFPDYFGNIVKCDYVSMCCQRNPWQDIKI